MPRFDPLARARFNAQCGARALAHLRPQKGPSAPLIAGSLYALRRAADRLTLLATHSPTLASFPETMHELTHNYKAVTDARFYAEKSINNLQRVDTEKFTVKNRKEYDSALKLLQDAKRKLNQLSQQKP